jgi:hypothetical protein
MRLFSVLWSSSPQSNAEFKIQNAEYFEKVARRRGAAPRKQSFGDSVAPWCSTLLN